MHKILIFTALFCIGCLSTTLTMASGWNKLHSPYPIFTKLPDNQKVFNGTLECPKTPETIHDMEYLSIYTDRSAGVSKVDQKAKKKYRKQIAALKKYEIQIYKWIEAAFQNKANNKKSINCAIKWLADWSKGKSMLGGKTNFQGEAIRKWMLASLSSHYIQVKDLQGVKHDQKQVIEKWLKQLGKQVIKDYNRNPKSMSRNNNHMYWAAWAVTITGVALNDKHFYHWGMVQYKKAMQQIQKDGTLPHELYREGKAFNYHLFATAPLIMMAETITQNGDKAYNYNSKAIHRLVDRVLVELDTDQKYIEHITKTEQNLEGSITPGQLAWMEVYYARFDDKRIAPWLNKLRPMIQRRIGGNMTRLYAQDFINE